MDIDPNLLEDFNEQLRQMTDLMGQNNSVMSSYLKSLNDLTSSTSDSTNATQKNTTANNNASQAAQDLANAEEYSARKIKEAQANLELSFRYASTGLLGFGSAALSGKEGLEKYSGSLTNAGVAASKIAENFGLLGTAVGLAIQALTKFGADALKLVDQTTNFRDELAKSTGVVTTSLENIDRFSREAKFSGERMAILQKATSGLGTSLTALGGSADQGATQFMKMASLGKDADETRKRFGMMGISQERLIDMQSKYIDLQGKSGSAYALQHMTMGQLQKQSLEYVENLARMSSLTGESADKLQSDRDSLASTQAVQLGRRREMLDLQEIGKTQGIKSQAYQDKLKEVNDHEKMLSSLSDRFGAKQAAALGEYMYQGISKNNASQVVGSPEVLTAIDRAKSGQLSPDQFDSAAVNARNAAENRFAYNPGVMYGDNPENLGFDLDTLKKSNIGLSDKNAEQTKKEYDDRVKLITDTNKNPMASGDEDLKRRERNLQSSYQEGLEKLIHLLGPLGLTGATLAATAALWGLSGAAVLGIGRGGLFGSIGNRLFGNMGVKAAGAAEGIGGAAEGIGGAGLLASGAEMEAGGVAADATGVGAPVGIGMNILGAGMMLGGAGLMAYNWLTGSGDNSSAQPTTASTSDQETPQTPDITRDNDNQDSGGSVDQSAIDARMQNTSGGGLIAAFRRLNESINRLTQSVDTLSERYGQDKTEEEGGGGGGGAGGGTPAGNSANAAEAMKFFIGQGWTKNQAAGIVGNLQQESGANLDPNISNSIGMYGIAQWDTSRRKEFEKIYGKSIYGSSFEDQLKYVQYELTNGNRKAAGDRLKQASNVNDAASIVTRLYEGAAGQDDAKRIANAQALAQNTDTKQTNFGGLFGGLPGIGGGFGSEYNIDPANAAQYINFSGASGGLQNLNGLQPNVKAALIRAAQQYYQQTGRKLTLNSGARSLQDQQRLWDNRANNPNPVAPPNPNSPHVRGSAVDIAEYNNPAALNALHSAGLYQTVRGDPVHFALQAANGGLFSGPDSGYPALLHGTEMIVPVDNAQHRAGSKLEELNNYTKSETLKQFSKVADPDTTRQMKDLMNRNSSVSGQGGTQIYDPAADRNLRLATDDNNLLKEIRDGINKMHGITNKNATEKASKKSKSTGSKNKSGKGYFERHPTRAGPAAYLGTKLLSPFLSKISSATGKVFSAAKSKLGSLSEMLFGKTIKPIPAEGRVIDGVRVGGGFRAEATPNSPLGKALLQKEAEESKGLLPKLAERISTLTKTSFARLSGAGESVSLAASKAFEPITRMASKITGPVGKLVAKAGGGLAGGISGIFSGYEEYSADKKKGNSTKTSLKKAGTVGTGAAVGAGIGELAGGTLGSLIGPVGTVLGATAGGAIGSWLGEKGGKLLADYMVKDDAKKKATVHPIKHPIKHEENSEYIRDFKIQRQPRLQLAVATPSFDNSINSYSPANTSSKIGREQNTPHNIEQHRPQEYVQNQQNNETSRHFEKLNGTMESQSAKIDYLHRAQQETNNHLAAIYRHIRE